MKILKIALISVISSVLMVLPSTAKEIRVGVAAGFTAIQAEGTETMKDSGTLHSTNASADAIIPSIFFEIASDGGLGLGFEHVPGSADINSATRSKSNNKLGTNDSGTNKASAEIDGLTSIYLIKTFESGFFVKAGQTSTTVNTKEVLSTGSKYDNDDITGSVFGLGINRTKDSGFFYRVSGEYTDYDSISLTSKTADAATGKKNKIKADIDTVAFKLSIGKAF
tara:strand:- start:202 stop:873 length:672 start_codon:yes stop_codon:yes gene_type:complete